MYAHFWHNYTAGRRTCTISQHAFCHYVYASILQWSVFNKSDVLAVTD